MFKKIYVEITNSCNLNCKFCIGNNRKKKFLEREEFIILLDKVKNYTKYLYFHVMGEPLLHPKINELIDIASKDFFVNITTNGYLIKKVEDNKNIRQLNISLHSFDDTNGKELEDYLEDIFTTVDKLLLNNTIVKYRLWINCKYKNKIENILEEKYQVVLNSKEVKLSNNLYFEIADEFIWPDYNNGYYEEMGSCMGCRSHIGILVDGTVIPCCLDSAGIIDLGNIYKQDISDIINSAKFNEIKKGFLEGKKIHPLCRHCNFYDLRR